MSDPSASTSAQFRPLAFTFTAPPRTSGSRSSSSQSESDWATSAATQHWHSLNLSSSEERPRVFHPPPLPTAKTPETTICAPHDQSRLPGLPLQSPKRHLKTSRTLFNHDNEGCLLVKDIPSQWIQVEATEYIDTDEEGDSPLWPSPEDVIEYYTDDESDEDSPPPALVQRTFNEHHVVSGVQDKNPYLDWDTPFSVVPNADYDADDSDVEDDRSNDRPSWPASRQSVCQSESPPRQTAGIRLLRRLPDNGNATTYLASLVCNGGGDATCRAGIDCAEPRLFVKRVKQRFSSEAKMSRDTLHLLEIRSYRRMACNPQRRSGVSYAKTSFVLPLDGFMDIESAFGPHQVFIFPLCRYDLFTLIQRGEKDFIKANFREWFAQIATGIQYLHSIGIIHRDIKTDNILLDWQNNAMITDLGLAYTHPTSCPLSTKQNYCFRAVGTRGFMAPEIQVIDWDEADATACYDPLEANLDNARYGPACDWWSFGATIFELALSSLKHCAEDLMGSYVDYWMSTIGVTPRPESPHTHFFVEKYGIADDLARLLWRLLDVNPTRRAKFIDLYDSDYLKLASGGKAGTVFDDLFTRSSSRPLLNQSERFGIVTRKADGPYLCTSNVREVWINSNSSTGLLLEGLNIGQVDDSPL